MQVDEYSLESRVVVEGIYLMLNMNDTNALQRAIQLEHSIKSSFVVRTSIQICLNFYRKHFYKVLRDIQALPHLVSAISSLQLPNLRKEILETFSIAYNSSKLTVPIDFLQKLLVYNDAAVLTKDLIDLGIHLIHSSDENEEKPTAVKFERKKFDNNKSIVSRWKVRREGIWATVIEGNDRKVT